MHYLDYFNQKYKAEKGLAPRVLDVFMNYDWPGNIRELTNTLEWLVVTAIDDIIRPEDFPLQFVSSSTKEIDYLYSLRGAVSNLEKSMIVKALRDQKTSRKAAGLLGISQSALMKKINKYGIKFDKTWACIMNPKGINGYYLIQGKDSFILAQLEKRRSFLNSFGLVSVKIQ